MAQGEYELGARVGLGIKLAHEAALRAASAAAAGGADFGQSYLGSLGTLAEPAIQIVIDLQAKYLAEAAFPGATTTPAPAAPVQQQSAPPPVPNQSSGGDWKAQKAEANWQLFFSDTTAWEDLRSQKAMGQIKSGNPDWRHRTQKDGDFKVGVWIKDAPQWARDRLAQMGVQL